MTFEAGAIYGKAELDTKKWNTSLKSLAKSTAIAGAAIAGAFAAYMTSAIKRADEFQKEMSNVDTLLDSTKISTQDLTKQLLQMDPALGSITDLTKGMYQAFSAGAKTSEEAFQITTDSAMFAKAALTDVNTAVDILTTAVNAYGRESMSSTRASDLYFQTIKQGKVTGEQLAASIGTSIPLFASAGIEMEQLTAAIAAMTKQGVDSANATTQLNAIVSEFLKPSEALTAVLKEQGYASGSALLEAEGLAGGLKLLEEASGGDATALAELLPNIRALRGTMALTGQGAEEFKNILKEMETSAGSTATAFEKQEKTFETLKNQMDKSKVVLGNIGKFFIEQVAVNATIASNKMLTFIMSSSGMEIISNIIAGLSAGWETLKGIISPIIDTLLPILTGLWDQVKERLVDVTGKTTDGAGAFKVLSIASNLVSSALTVIGKVISWQIDYIADLITAIRESAQVLGTFFNFLSGKATWEEVKIQAQEAGGAFKDLGKNYVNNIKEVYETARSEIKEFSGETETLAANLEVNVTTAFDSTKEHIVKNWDVMVTGSAEAVGFIGENLLELPVYTETITDDILDDFENLYGDIYALTNASVRREEVLWEDALFDQATRLQEAGIGWKTYYDEIGKGANSFYDSLTSLSSLYYDTKLRDENLSASEIERIKEKQFKAEKRNKIGEAWMSAAKSIMGWWEAAPSLGPIAGPIFAGIMTGVTTAAALVQTGLIASQQYIPSKEIGGIASGLTRVNEKGGEIISLPDNSLVIPNDISRQIAQSAGSQNIINVSFAGATISDSVSLDRVVEQVAKKIGKQMRLVG